MVKRFIDWLADHNGETWFDLVVKVFVLFLICGLFSAAIVVPIAIATGHTDQDRIDQCSTIDAKPVYIKGNIYFCERPDHVVVTIPKEASK